MSLYLKNKIPISGIVLPFLYAFSSIVCFIYSEEIFSATYLKDALLSPEFQILKIGLFHLIFALIIRLIFVKFRDAYIFIIPILALYELLSFGLDLFIFSQFQVQHILYTGFFHLGLFTLLMYERKLFRR
tara:strand:+ start:876 stop:1265 length:390 start_codon:yes stop_codon:yes gene_type:complete